MSSFQNLAINLSRKVAMLEPNYEQQINSRKILVCLFGMMQLKTITVVANRYLASTRGRASTHL